MEKKSLLASVEAHRKALEASQIACRKADKMEKQEIKILQIAEKLHKEESVIFKLTKRAEHAEQQLWAQLIAKADKYRVTTIMTSEMLDIRALLQLRLEDEVQPLLKSSIHYEGYEAIKALEDAESNLLQAQQDRDRYADEYFWQEQEAQEDVGKDVQEGAQEDVQEYVQEEPTVDAEDFKPTEDYIYESRSPLGDSRIADLERECEGFRKSFAQLQKLARVAEGEGEDGGSLPYCRSCTRRYCDRCFGQWLKYALKKVGVTNDAQPLFPNTSSTAEGGDGTDEDVE